MSTCKVYIIKFPLWLGWAGIVMMPLFHAVLFLQKNISFYKLMGSGKGGTFSAVPSFSQWAILTVSNVENPLPAIVAAYLRLFKAKLITISLTPIMGRGTWDNKQCFVYTKTTVQSHQSIAVLTRASIKLNKAISFWKAVPKAAQAAYKANGLQHSYGLGEMPFIRQATLSIWDNEDAVKQYAYKQQEHREVIAFTREQQWYSEEMFVRFRVDNIEQNY